MQAGIYSLQNKPPKGRVVNPCGEYQKNRKFIRTSQNTYSSLEWNTNIQELGKPNISRQVYPKASHNQNLWFERQEEAQDCERNQITQHPPMSPIQKSGQIPYSLGANTQHQKKGKEKRKEKRKLLSRGNTNLYKQRIDEVIPTQTQAKRLYPSRPVLQ